MTTLDASAFKILGEELFHRVNVLIDKWEKANEQELHAGGADAVMEATFPNGRRDDNAEAYDAVRGVLDTLLKRSGVPTSDEARRLLAAAREQRERNFDTYLETERLRLTQEFKVAYMATQRNGISGKEYLMFSNRRSEVTAEIIQKFGADRGADIMIDAVTQARAELG